MDLVVELKVTWSRGLMVRLPHYFCHPWPWIPALPAGSRFFVGICVRSSPRSHRNNSNIPLRSLYPFYIVTYMNMGSISLQGSPTTRDLMGFAIIAYYWSKTAHITNKPQHSNPPIFAFDFRHFLRRQDLEPIRIGIAKNEGQLLWA